ncbi:MAG: GSCFA domain-containing protein [Prolixibacteraceae bacterium]|jgi:hypothetical protein|nr:GSCFA domain-containing protein [Prolixibacteraceae bacterium]MBT6004907.1 GSCFA domain-containing protein [Prolixibacteraceae bacterium]MBT6766881.1 GSCFA domain-containing protein [Prolixibacteraceae bacterium]MBT6999929.1 GSCFA domain-containing protein [Prolixibacteraceae bacterium]MBT7393587.1 GSCFA domain-containing protein [Prolixibacteraceae bacterium]
MAPAKFQTIVETPLFKWKTGYQKKNLFMGSCFTENIGGRLADLKYKVDINPFGILYNPASIANGLRFLLNKKIFTAADLIKKDGLWHSFYHHGKYSSADENKTLNTINSRIASSLSFFKNADFLFLTFGTAWIYQFSKTGQTVSNCHKIEANKFIRKRLSVSEIVNEYRKLLSEIWKINPDIKVIFTVSPIRHWKDGAVENQRSKATLLLAINELLQIFGEEKCAYFQAYEIVMDELRDYRFYAEDMIHLSDVALNHIWDIFEHSFIETESRNIAAQVKKILKAMNHIPFNKVTNAYLNFLNQYLKRITQLNEKHPALNFKLEKEFFTHEIDSIEKGLEKIKLNDLS